MKNDGLTSCPVCLSKGVRVFLSRNRVPVHQNLLMSSQAAAINTVRGDMDLCFCSSCGFIYNKLFDPTLLSYGAEYDNTQICSPLFYKYTHDLVQQLIVDCGIKNQRIIEVGCGKGHFLKELCSSDDIGNRGIGFDPSYIGPEESLGGSVHFEKRFYSQNCSEIPADVVVCRHVIEHVQSPLSLLCTIRRALVNSPHARVFFETPCVKWILKNQVLWDFFYEHCSYFTAESLTTAFESSGFRVEKIQHVFEGQYLWLEASISTEKPVITKNPDSIPHMAEQFAASESNLKRNWKSKIKKLATKGKVAIWGGGCERSDVCKSH